MKKTIALILSLALALALAACGGSDKPTGSPEPPSQPDSVASIDPDDVEWGYESPGLPDTEHWYADGVKSKSDYIFFDDNYLTVVKSGEATQVLMDIEDMHFLDNETGGQTYDFVFSDWYACYDNVSKQWYKRCDYDAMTASLTATDFVDEADSTWTLTFNADGTMSYNHNGEPRIGTWSMERALTINYHFDDEADGQGGWFKIFYNEMDWTVERIEDMNVFYPAA